MDDKTIEKRKFPIGLFTLQDTYSTDELAALIDTIETSPAQYRQLVANFSFENLAKTYRDGSWTVRQIVYHVADIQLVHYLRMKKALTEPKYTEATTIDMNAWAAMPDATTAPIEDSLHLFEGVHQRYARLAKSLDAKDLAISYWNPARKLQFNQMQALAISAWHVQHHLAHIKLALGLLSV